MREMLLTSSLLSENTCRCMQAVLKLTVWVSREITPPMKASDLSSGLVVASRKHRMPMKSQLIPEYHKSYLKDPNGTVFSG